MSKNLLMTNGPDFRVALTTVCTALLPKAEIMAEETSRTLISCLGSLMRKEITSYLSPNTAIDKRARSWRVKFSFFDDEGEITDPVEETIYGLPAIGEAMREYLQYLHQDDGYDVLELPEFSVGAVARRISGMYPAISRGGGEATLHMKYKLGGEHYRCQIDMARKLVDFT